MSSTVEFANRPSDLLDIVSSEKAQTALDKIEGHLITFFSSNGMKFNTEAQRQKLKTRFITPIETYITFLKKDHKFLSDKSNRLTAMVNSKNIEAFNKAAKIEDSLRSSLPSDNISSVDISTHYQETISQIQEYLTTFFSSKGEKFDTEATKCITPIESYVVLLKKENKSLSDKVKELTAQIFEINRVLLETLSLKSKIARTKADAEDEITKIKAETEDKLAKIKAETSDKV
ncbi:MAG: hypothetical protein K1060chlam2_00824 [Chlamydiae bacterium]|nr:hypothetical protein [Chlamydiota bacterium]